MTESIYTYRLLFSLPQKRRFARNAPNRGIGSISPFFFGTTFPSVKPCESPFLTMTQVSWSLPLNR
jgi:hypothetical protein